MRSISCISSLAAAAILFSSVIPQAQCLPEGSISVLVSPTCATATDSASLYVEGWFSDGCWSELRFDSSYTENDTIEVFATGYHSGSDLCPQVIVEYQFPVPGILLRTGDHQLALNVNILHGFDSSDYTGTYRCNFTAHVYVPGDLNLDGFITSSDVFSLIEYVYLSGPDPPCDMGEVNCDGRVNAADIIYLVIHMFKGGPPPRAGC